MLTLRYDLLKANKEHVCNYCLEKINKGEHYYNSGHAYEGTVYTWKGHVNCSRLLTELNMDGDEGITQEIFWEDVKQEYYNLVSEEDDKKRTFKEMLDYVINKVLD